MRKKSKLPHNFSIDVEMIILYTGLKDVKISLVFKNLPL